MPKYKVQFEGYCIVKADSPEDAKYLAADGDEIYKEEIFFNVERIYNEDD